jgi:hypothetical protein
MKLTFAELLLKGIEEALPDDRSKPEEPKMEMKKYLQNQDVVSKTEALPIRIDPTKGADRIVISVVDAHDLAMDRSGVSDISVHLVEEGTSAGHPFGVYRVIREGCHFSEESLWHCRLEDGVITAVLTFAVTRLGKVGGR